MEKCCDVWMEGLGRYESLAALTVALTECTQQGHSFGSRRPLKHDITAVSPINFCIGSVDIMTYSWLALSYWPDSQYWFIEETRMLSWQLQVMVGGNRAGDEEESSLSFELYCCYGFSIREKDGLLYWPTTSMRVGLNHSCQGEPSSPSANHNKNDPVPSLLCMPDEVFVHQHSCVRVFLTGLCARWLLLPEEVHQVRWSSALVNADLSYVHSPPSSTRLW